MDPRSRSRCRSRQTLASLSSVLEGTGMDTERLVLQAVIDRCRRDGDGYDCFREGDAYLVRLWGNLPPAWAGNLALHASARGIEILSGDAARIGGARWAAVFLLRAAHPRTQLGRHDFLLMARRAARFLPRLPEPELQIALEDAREGSNLVVARVRGKDAIGLLAETLRRFEALSLRPRRFSLRARNDEIDDCFWLERV